MPGCVRTMFNEIWCVTTMGIRNMRRLGRRDISLEMKGISELRRGCLVWLGGGMSLVFGSSVLAQIRMRISMRRVVLPVRLAGIGAARRLCVMLGSGWTGFRSV